MSEFGLFCFFVFYAFCYWIGTNTDKLNEYLNSKFLPQQEQTTSKIPWQFDDWHIVIHSSTNANTINK